MVLAEFVARKNHENLRPPGNSHDGRGEVRCTDMSVFLLGFRNDVGIPLCPLCDSVLSRNVSSAGEVPSASEVDVDVDKVDKVASTGQLASGTAPNHRATPPALHHNRHVSDAFNTI